MKKSYIILATVFMFTVLPSFASATFGGGHSNSNGKWNTPTLGTCEPTETPQECGSTVGTQTVTKTCSFSWGKDECNPGMYIAEKSVTPIYVCPKDYHIQNSGNWNQKCHRDHNWQSPEHKSPISASCPEGSVQTGSNSTIQCKIAAHYDPAPETQNSTQTCTLATPDYRSCTPAQQCSDSCGQPATEIADGKGGYTTCSATPACEPEVVCDPEVNLLKNGSFETPVLEGGNWGLYESSIVEWFINWIGDYAETPTLEIQNNVAGNSSNGEQHAELDGDHPVTIWQDIATNPGYTYKLNFDYSPRATVDANDNSITVKADGSTLGDILSLDGTSNTDTAWVSESRTFEATGETTKVEFTDSGTDNSLGGYLDNVSLYCQPKEDIIDTDNDDIPDSSDNCPNVVNKTQADADGDGVGDVCDETPNGDETCTPTNDGIEIADGIDNDCDGTIDEGISQEEQDICPNVKGTQTEGTCEDELCLNPNSWNTETQTCNEPTHTFYTSSTPSTSSSEPQSEGKVLGASTSCIPYLNSFIEYGNKKNDKEEVKKLQEFLNEYLGLKLKVDGVYGKGTFNAVKAFQVKHGDDVLSPWVKLGSLKKDSKGTGYVYKTTQWKINSLKCPDEVIPVPAL